MLIQFSGTPSTALHPFSDGLCYLLTPMSPGAIVRGETTPAGRGGLKAQTFTVGSRTFASDSGNTVVQHLADKQEEQHMGRIIGRVVGILVAGLMISPPLFAQNTASIAGTVRDSSGSVLPGVTVTSTQTDTGLDADGRLGRGRPLHHFESSGGPLHGSSSCCRASARSCRPGIVLQVNGSPTINAALEIGNVEESVTVQGESPLIETRSVGIGMVVDNQRVLELPLNGRETLDLVFHDGHGGLGRHTGRRARRGHFHISRHHRRGRRPAERHDVHARRRDAQRSVQRLVDAVAVSGGAAGIQGRDQRPAGPVRASLGGRGQRGDQIRDEYNQRHPLRVLRDDALNATDPFAPIGAGRQAAQRRPESQPVRRRDWRPDRPGPGVLLRRLPAHQDPAGPRVLVPVRADAGDAERRFHRHRVGGVQHRRGDHAQGAVRRTTGSARRSFLRRR